jgi:F-box/TPR repeat protein Pof3
LELADASSQAISVSNGSILFMALDHRAASYEKLGLLQAALRDSKQMIDLKPDFAKV